MANEFTNLVALKDGTIIMDLTQDDVEAKHVDKNIWFHDRTGRRQQGTSEKTVDASGATAVAAEVLDGSTFGKGSSMETGTMPNKKGKDIIIDNKDGTPIPFGCYDETGRVRLSDADLANLIPENIKEGITLLGIPGGFGADDISSISKEVTPTFEDKTYNPADDGVTFYSSFKVNAIKVTRADNDFGGVTVTIG